MIIRFQELKSMPEAQRLMKTGAVVLCVWILAFILLSNALFLKTSAAKRLTETDEIVSAAGVVKSYPTRKISAGKEPLSAVSNLLDTLSLRSRVSQMSSSASGLVLQVNDLYPGEVTALIDAISGSGLSVRTAEIRAIASNQKGRLMTVSFVLEGDTNQ
jgi:hypothetical protein